MRAGNWFNVVALAAMSRPLSCMVERSRPAAAAALRKSLVQRPCFAACTGILLPQGRQGFRPTARGHAFNPARQRNRYLCTMSDGAGDSSAAEALKRAISTLEGGGVPEASASAELLLSAVTGASRNTIRLKGRSMELTSAQRELFQSHVTKRLARTPVQYIIGEWDFYNLNNIIVRPPTLIPRPETEELVDRIIQAHPSPPSRFLEVGPGSGVISLSLLKAWPGATAVCVDLCEHACLLTADNAKLTGLSSRISVIHSGISDFEWTGQKFGLVVSNPPYIPSQNMSSLEPELLSFEDPVALDGGEDGLDIVREILLAAQSMVEPRGEVWMEVDESHPEILAGGAGCPQGIEPVECFRDMSERPRFVRWRVL